MAQLMGESGNIQLEGLSPSTRAKLLCPPLPRPPRVIGPDGSEQVTPMASSSTWCKRLLSGSVPPSLPCPAADTFHLGPFGLRPRGSRGCKFGVAASTYQPGVHLSIRWVGEMSSRLGEGVKDSSGGGGSRVRGLGKTPGRGPLASQHPETPGGRGSVGSEWRPGVNFSDHSALLQRPACADSSQGSRR